MDKLNALKAVNDNDKYLWEQLVEVPKVSQIVAIISAILNIILPGFGTIVAACAVDDLVSKTHVLCGILQFFTAFILVGWIWSIYWGWLIFARA